MLELVRNAALVVVVLLLVLVVSTASAMDTKAAGRCVAFGMTYKKNYEAKARAIIATAAQTGEGPLVAQSVREALDELDAINRAGKDQYPWVSRAIDACNQF